MKSLLLFFLTILSLQAYEINFNKNFSKSVKPDILTTSVNIIVEKKDEQDVSVEIEKFNDYIKNNDLVKFKDGRFSLTPKYSYLNNKQKFLGYSGNLYYKIETQDAKNINSFINELMQVKDKINSEDIKLNISNINWEISENLYNKNLDDLRFEVVSWAGAYANELSNKLAKNCVISKIDINVLNRGNIYHPRNAMVVSSMKVESEVAPINSNENIDINPNFVLECK